MHVLVSARPHDRSQTLSSGQSWSDRRRRAKHIPCSVTPMNACGCSEARIASIAMVTDPSVPFLKPAWEV